MSAIVQERLGKKSTAYRWVQLVIGIICMAMIANLQADQHQCDCH